MLPDPPTHPRVFILGVPISRLGLAAAIQYCADRVRARAGGYVCFANVHTVTEAQGDPAVMRALSEAFLSVADGTPLVWVSKLRGEPIASRVCGPDFMMKFLREYRDLKHGFIGGEPGQGKALAGRFGLDASSYSPPMRPFSPEAAHADWHAFQALTPGEKPPAIVWVGLGAPKQEFWMQTVSAIAPETLFFGVGAAFDFLAGTKRRAPLWMQKIGLEWLFRLGQEPRRLWRRYLVANTRFIVNVALHFRS